VTLPTDLAVIRAASVQDHVDWHNEIDGLVPFLGLPTVTTATASGHLAAHEALHALVGGDLPLEVHAGDPGEAAHHQAIHTYLTDTTITSLTTASDVQAALTAGANGQVFGLAAGKYRVTTALAPKQDQTLYGAYGAIINGSLELTSWTQSGSDWWASRAAGTVASKPDDPGDGNRCAITGCENPNDVFYDGSPLVRVTSQGALATGRFYEDFAAGRVYIRDAPAGHLVEQAVAARLVRPTASGVKIRNLVCEMAANLSQTAAVELAGSGGLVEACEARYNHGHGIRTEAADGVVRRCLIHHQMQMGVGGTGSDCLWENNEWWENNRDGSYAAGWEAGGTKWGECDRLTIRGNQAHDNHGIGLWIDINAGNIIIEDNFVWDNDQWGIFYEIAYGEVTLGDGLKSHIRRNYSYDNNPTSPTGFFEGGQIAVSGSRDVEIYQNTVRGQDGIGAMFQARADHPDPRGDHEVWNLHVYDNDIEQVWDGAGWGLIAGLDGDDGAQMPDIWTSRGNSFEANRYYLASSTRAAWVWEVDFRTWTVWQGTYGHDDTGSRAVGGQVTIPSPPALLAGPRGNLS
jgi:hypothetical protein